MTQPETIPAAAVLRAGEKIQLTDPKGRMHTIVLAAGEVFHTHKGLIGHDEIIGRPEGIVVTNSGGVDFQVFRPFYEDFVLSMPRGAAVVYPKDSGLIVTLGDIRPGATVVEAGVGSGALTMSLLRAVGDGGSLLSVERREDFAVIARGNVEAFFGADHPAWELATGDLADVLPRLRVPGSVDRVVLDMLAPWENIDVVADALAPGGVVIAYVATATQLSRFAEDLKADGRFTEPTAWESLVRGWHLEGLAVRPEHRMVGHTGFLVTARRMAPGVEPPLRRRRPQKATQTEDAAAAEQLAADAARVQIGDDWSPADFGEPVVTEKKARKAGRESAALRAAAARSAATARPGDETD
ncbi:MAG TPA: SAM-dependent methyltransferase [Micrococcales bacterium]|nr:SAM-dependent methyltransferase [Micrococcales bacterium]